MNAKTFITIHEHERCQAVKEIFSFHLNESNNKYLVDCRKYGFCFFEEFTHGNFESADYY